MSETRQTSPQDTTIQRAIMIGHFIVVTSVLFLAFGIYLVTQTAGAWQAFVFALMSIQLMAGGLIGVSLIRRGQYARGSWVIYISNWLAPLVTSIVMYRFGLIAIAYVALASFILIRWAMPRLARKWTMAQAIFILIVMGALELANPAWRLVSEITLSAAPIATTIMGIFFLAVFFIAQRWGHIQIRTKLVFSVGFILLGIISTLTFYSVNNIRRQVEADEEEKMLLLYSHYNHYVSTIEESAASLALAIANRQDVVDLYKAKDRQGLLDLLTPLFTTLKSDYNIVHLYIENPDGTVFLRVHNPASYGDEVTYRYTAADALETHQTVAGVEIGPSRMGVRGVTPLYDGDQFIGMVEVGVDYDQSFIQGLKLETNVDYTMWITQEAAAPAGLKAPDNAPTAPHSDLLFYASTYPDTLAIPEDIYQQVLESQTPAPLQYIDVDNKGIELAVLVAPILGYGDRTIGIFEIVSNRAKTLDAIQLDVQTLLIASGIAVVVGLFILWLISQFIIVSPIEQLLSTSQQQIGGDLSARVQIPGSDEFNKLGNTFNALTERVQELISGLEVRVAERTMELEVINRQIKHRASQFEAVAKVAQASATIQELGALLPRITELISQHFGYYHAGIFMLDSADEYAFLAAANSEGGQQMLARQHRLRVGAEGIVGYVTKTGNPRIALKVGEDSIHFNNPDLPNTQSEMALPLKIGDRIIGALDVQSKAANAFSEDDVEILSTLADQVSLAIENARLFDETRRLLKESQTAFGERIQTSWKQTKSRFKTLGYSLSGAQIQPLQNPLKNDEIRQAVQTGHLVVSQNKKKNLPKTVAIPIKIRERVVGTLNIQFPPGYDWDTDEVDITETIAERVGLAIETAALLEETSIRAAFEHKTSEISDKLSSSTRFDTIIRTAAEELSKALGGSDVLVQIQPEAIKEKDKTS